MNDLTVVDPLDQDGDGITDLDELNVLGTNPLSADTDADGALDGADNCPVHFDSSQADFDSDGEGDICDQDDGRLLFNSMTTSFGRLSRVSPPNVS